MGRGVFWFTLLFIILMPVIGLISCVAIIQNAPDSWEGFGWNPAFIKGVKVLFWFCVPSVILSVCLLIRKLAALLHRD